MRLFRPAIASSVALSLALGGFGTSALAQGLIPTERVASVPSAQAAGPLQAAAAVAAQRVTLSGALVAGGVEPAHADARVAALSDAEIARLAAEFDTAPAGGLWFVPFLVVAAVIGALIGTRDSAASGKKTSSDLFGRPLDIATAP